MKPPHLVIFENIQCLCTKKKRKENYSVMKKKLLGMEKMQLYRRGSYSRPLYLRSDAQLTELTGHRR
jgi:hypothetical protein